MLERIEHRNGLGDRDGLGDRTGSATTTEHMLECIARLKICSSVSSPRGASMKTVEITARFE